MTSTSELRKRFGQSYIFAKLKILLRKAAERSVEATWRRIGTLLDAVAGERAKIRFLEFFAVKIRNPRAAPIFLVLAYLLRQSKAEQNG